MAAANTDKFRKSYSFTQKTLNGSITDSATTLTLNNATNLPTDTAVSFVVDRVDSNGNLTPNTRELMTGVVSGSTVTNLLRGEHGTTAQAHSSGAVVEFVNSGKAWNDLMDGILADHSQSGAHEVATNYDPANPTLETQKWAGVSSAVNEFTMSNAATGTPPSLVATGGDTNIDALFGGKGTGVARFYGNHDGWTLDTDTWTYVSATSFKITGKDVSTRFPVGTKLRLTQTTAKYFYVVSSTFSTDTTVTVTGGADYSLANAAITLPYYSYASSPVGFPQWFAFTPGTTTGWSGTPTTTGTKFKIEGRTIFYRLYVSGTSNTTGISVSLPIASSTLSVSAYGFVRGTDNGAALTVPALTELGSAASTITIYPTLTGGSWTSSGTKTIHNSLIVYEI